MGRNHCRIAIRHQSIKPHPVFHLNHCLTDDWIIAPPGQIITGKCENLAFHLCDTDLFILVFGKAVLTDPLNRKDHVTAFLAAAAVDAKD